jgi:hypothetical protein
MRHIFALTVRGRLLKHAASKSVLEGSPMISTKLAAGTAVLCALSLAPASATTISSTFDTGAEGWTALDAVGFDYDSSWQGTGGNPGGFLEGVETDSVGGTGYFIAPGNYLGNLSAYAGGSLSYDFKVIQGTDYFNDADVIISNGSTSVSWHSNINPVGSGWAPFQVQLTSANFGANLASVLSNVTELQIRGEFISGPEEEGLDNVLLQTPASAAPEPATWSMLILGFGGIGMAFRRRTRAVLNARA